MNKPKTRGEPVGLRLLIMLSDLYLIGILVWINLHNLCADRWWWLFALNSLAIYFFIPLPLTLSVTLFTGRRELWLGHVVVIGSGLLLYGELLLPPAPPARAPTPAPPLTVMTYNIYYNHPHPHRVGAVIRAANADLVALQELTPATKQAMHRDLSPTYPYQRLDAGETGVLSRYPLAPHPDTITGDCWYRPPQILTMDFHGRPVTVLNIHAAATGPGTPAAMTFTIRMREAQARQLAAFVAAHREEPLLLLGDFNTTAQGHAYDLLTAQVRDAWRAGGWGLGHTYTYAGALGQAPLTGITLLDWVVRIDYVFHSAHWRTHEAHIGPWDGISDHRPVVATLALTPPDAGSPPRAR